MKRIAISLCASALAMHLAAQSAQGQTPIEWANLGTPYEINLNWVGGFAPADSTTTNIAQFGAQNAGPINPLLGGARSVRGVAFLSGAYAYTFSGAILTVGTSGIVNSATNTETFSNTLRLSINQTWTSNAGATLVLNGITDLNATAATSRSLTLAGAGVFTFNGVIQNSFAGSTSNLTYNGTGTLNLNNTNTYNGNTVISSGNVAASKDGALGGGNVSLTGGAATLTLQGGATNNYIANSANLNIGFTTNVVNLNYVGSDIIGSLTVAGVQQAPGIYGSAASGAPNKLPNLFGIGTFTVLTQIPEPATYMLMGLGVLVCAQQFRRKRS